MKTSLRKQAFFLALTGLLVTGLVLMTNMERGWYETSVEQVDVLRESLLIPVTKAKEDFSNFSADAEKSAVEKDVLVNLDGAKSFLQNLYDGKDSKLAGAVDGSESVRVSIKLALVEIDKAIESVKAKSPAVSFDKSLSEIRSLIVHVEKQESSRHSLLNLLSALSVAALLVAFGGITVWNYISDKRRLEVASAIDQKLAQEAKRVDTLSNFIEAMASGNYSIELDNEKNDELSSTLVTMRDKLKINAEEDQRRNWATSGLAQIGEILRSTTNSVELYDNIVRFVVKYTKSNQGGLFIFNDDDSQDTYLELVACYAFERKKFLAKRLDLGQGLVGQCFLEKEKIHLREVPQDYVRITSGLGGENPTSCLLVPLKINEKIYGVFELASFSNYQEYEIELVEKLAESIASTISAVRINESTRMLLERTQQQAEEMKSQEEEMRQNMEELSATQEEMQRKEREYIQRIEDLEEQQAVLAR